MEPTKVKIWGIMSLTRSGYVRMQIIVFLILGGAFLFSLLWEVPTRLSGNWLWDNLALIVVVVVALEILETYLTLGKFRDEE